MIQRITPLVLAAVSPLFLGSCALIFEGTSDPVAFNSRQSGATVTVDGESHSLPATVEVSKKTTSATFSHPQHKPRTLNWKRKYQWGFFALDFLFTPGYGLVGFITDGTTNAWYKQPGVIDYDFKSGQTNVELTEPETDSAN